MATIMQPRVPGVMPRSHIQQPERPTAPAPSATAEVIHAKDNAAAAPLRFEAPKRLVRLEPQQPLTVIDSNPVFGTEDAARILGASEDRLKKWRQRDQGPDYIQYETGGAVRYELSALMAFRAAHRVKPRS
jgi:hypothetical protein